LIKAYIYLYNLIDMKSTANQEFSKFPKFQNIK